MDKTFILDEIRRTAAENGGKPLGLARFQSEMGIRRSELLGVHWARWGDALSEAGFSPNQLQQAYSTSDLIQLYSELAKELGHLPVKDEVKMKHRSDPAYPGWDPFTRLGNRSERIRRVAAYCKSEPGYEDVAKWCDAYLTNKPSALRDEVDVTDEPALGYVYLVKSGRHHKIGKSNSAGRREYEIGLQLPEKLKMVHVITTDDPTGIEAYWHKRFEASRKMASGLTLNPKTLQLSSAGASSCDFGAKQ